MNYDDYLKLTGLSPNEKQAEAIRSVEGATLLLAVPGSGKTSALIARTGYMVNVAGIDPSSILVITYTRAATATMKERYEALFGSSDGIEFRTIHGLCALILKYFERTTGRRVFRLADGAELKALLREIMTEVRKTPPTEADMNEVSTLITYHINMLTPRYEIAASDTEIDDFPEIFDRYQSEKKRLSVMDHDDQLVYAYRILCSYGDILKAFRDKYRYISVDEAQDTSRLQHMIIRKLVTGSIFMVGDEDQSIYGFRAAYPDALLNFASTYDGAKVLLMETNYRSTPQITEFANAFIRRNKSRYDKSMQAARKDSGIKPKLIELHDFSSVYSYICALAKKSDTETAVLYRTNDSALPLIDLLDRMGIEYNLLGSDTYFTGTRFVVRLLNLFRFLIDPDDEELFMRTYSLLGVRLKADNAEEAVRLHQSIKHKDLLRVCADYSLVPKSYTSRMKYIAELVSRAKKLSSYDFLKMVNDEFYSDKLSQTENSSEYIRFNVMLSIASQYPDKSQFLRRLTEIEKAAREHMPCKSRLTLSTIHSAKGLEFERVLIIDVKPYLLPSVMPKHGLTDEDTAALEEDRRLFYVAATRAKSELFVFTSDFENGAPIDRSPFITESFFPNRRIEYDTTPKAVKVQRAASKAAKSIFAQEVQIPAPGIKEQERIRSRLVRDAQIEHRTLGAGRIITVTDKLIRVKLFSDGRIVPFDIETTVKKGLIKITEEAEE